MDKERVDLGGELKKVTGFLDVVAKRDMRVRRTGCRRARQPHTQQQGRHHKWGTHGTNLEALFQAAQLVRQLPRSLPPSQEDTVTPARPTG